MRVAWVEIAKESLLNARILRSGQPLYRVSVSDADPHLPEGTTRTCGHMTVM